MPKPAMTSDDIPNTEPPTPTAETVETVPPAPEPEPTPTAEAPIAETPPEPVAAAPETAAPAPEVETAAPAEEVPTPTEAAAPTETPAHVAAAEATPDATPPTTPAAEAAVEATPAPKKPRKPKAAPAPVPEPVAEVASGDVAGADIAAILGSSSESEETPTEAEAPAPEASTEAAPAAPPAPESNKRWYAVKIQSGREESIKAAIERKIKIEGLEEFYGQIMIPVEEVIVKKKVKVKNKKTGETTTQEKNVTKYNKKFPGYLFAEVEFNNDILYVFRETSGVGDFVGVNTKKSGGAIERSPPAPMTDDEVKSMLTGAPSPDKKRGDKGRKVVVKLDVEKGDKVRIRNGAFAGNEGEVKAILEAKDPTESPKLTVEVTIWGRPVPIELDYWEVDKV